MSAQEAPPLPFEDDESEWLPEHSSYLSDQLITYIGNKRALASTLDKAIGIVRQRLGGRRLTTLDLFAGSGFVSRLLKRHSTQLTANDLETYSYAANRCHLTNLSTAPIAEVRAVVNQLNSVADEGLNDDGFIRELYSPRDDRKIQLGERAFYSNENARRLDFFTKEIAGLPDELRYLLLGPLLSEASVHANTSGVFKGFYKDKHTGIGKFGGSAGDALKRILDPIRLEVPVLSRFDSDVSVTQADANELVTTLTDLDLAYLDPPYNQHPYGSNYFMLNLLVENLRPKEVSTVSGIPVDWRRSGYNVRQQSLSLMRDLIERLPARFVLISFNSEGYIDISDLRRSLEEHGQVEEFVSRYNTFRGSRNLRDRSIHVNEHLFLLERR